VSEVACVDVFEEGRSVGSVTTGDVVQNLTLVIREGSHPLRGDFVQDSIDLVE